MAVRADVTFGGRMKIGGLLGGCERIDSLTDCANMEEVPYNCTSTYNGGDHTYSTGEIQQRRQSSEHSSLVIQEHHQSSIELFSKYIARSLETLPRSLAVLAQKEMHDILVDYKITAFNEKY
ncbi:Hypothetical protein CINCED_3A008894 [Cinara cedri]|uniref:Uncharacterized protein n=1 Tax=Cinara cedri TaxID=506608 RepID=A0A5E4NPB9_9HEMI|nr:Hypothetical protein CINCED_3A008894 [Cinara cedri]